MSSLPSFTWSVQLRDLISSPLAIVAMTCLVGFLAYVKNRREHPTYDDEDYVREGHVKIPAPLKDISLTRKELERYNCDNPNGEYLVALMGTIYDVSSAPHDFGPNGNYSRLPGTDIQRYIQNAARFEAHDENKHVNDWKDMLEDHFYAVGVMLTETKNDASDSDGSTIYDKDDKDDYNELKSEGRVNSSMDDTLVDWSQADQTLLAP